jgi:hypothetical protein
MLPDAAELERKYEYSAAAYWYTQRHCHDEIAPARAAQRDITRWSLEVVRGARPDVQPFTGLLIQFTSDGDVPNRIAPDSVVFVYDPTLEVGTSFDVPFQPVGPMLVADYREEKPSESGARELGVPYYLLFYPDGDEMTLFRLSNGKYVTVTPGASGRCAIPELELEVALLDRWVRYWFRGELVPLPGELVKERDAERAARAAAETQAATERAARQAAEAELAKLREELAKAKRQP